MTKRHISRYKSFRRVGGLLWRTPISKPWHKTTPGEHAKLKRTQSVRDVKLTQLVTTKQKFFFTQKIKSMYPTVSKRQFDRYRRSNLFQLLESRLDTTLFRILFAPTPFAARQFISHGQVAINGTRVFKPSYMLQQGDVIQLMSRDNHMRVLKVASTESGDRDLHQLARPSRHFELNYRIMSAINLRAPNA